MKNKILIVGGDPNSINSEILIKTWRKLNTSLRKRIILISNYDLISKQIKLLKLPTKISLVKDINQNKGKESLKILNINLNFRNPFKVEKSSASHFIKKSLNTAHNLALKNDVMGIINCAIDKNLLGRKKIGVTEYLAAKCKIKNNSEVMLIRNKFLSVCPITTHIDVREVPKKLNKHLIINKVKTINHWFKKNLGKKPSIGILGLNPHNAEYRKNSEEVRIIIPAIKKCKALGANITGPLVSDNIFIKDYKNYDVLIGMYHDQVLSPFKSLFKFDAINITLGLKYIRLSPDHGTAYKLIKKNMADPTSLIECLNFFKNLKK